MSAQLGKRVVLGVTGKADKSNWAFLIVFRGETAMVNSGDFVDCLGFWCTFVFVFFLSDLDLLLARSRLLERQLYACR